MLFWIWSSIINLSPTYHILYNRVYLQMEIITVRNKNHFAPLLFLSLFHIYPNFKIDHKKFKKIFNSHHSILTTFSNFSKHYLRTNPLFHSYLSQSSTWLPLSFFSSKLPSKPSIIYVAFPPHPKRYPRRPSLLARPFLLLPKAANGTAAPPRPQTFLLRSLESIERPKILQNSYSLQHPRLVHRLPPNLLRTRSAVLPLLPPTLACIPWNRTQLRWISAARRQKQANGWFLQSLRTSTRCRIHAL